MHLNSSEVKQMFQMNFYIEEFVKGKSRYLRKRRYLRNQTLEKKMWAFQLFSNHS